MSIKILAICGSIRLHSSNMGVLLALNKLLNRNFSFEILPSIESIPHFSPELTIPTSVRNLRNKIKESDYVVICTPEYAHGIPGVLKNALDWLVSDEDFPNTKVGLIMASTGDAKNATSYLTEVLKTMSADINSETTLNVSAVRNKVSKDGQILDVELEDALKSFAANFFK